MHHALAVAPMMGYTDRHGRRLFRLCAPRAMLYTEMITTGALLARDGQRHLAFDGTHPVGLQLGGSDPAALAAAARLGVRAGYDEVNLNAGCPSPRVTQHCFGVRLMLDPAGTADCVRAMADAVTAPITIKCRLGVDDQCSDTFIDEFVGRAIAAGARTVIVHARRALLACSPRENRDVPPLERARVWRLKTMHATVPMIVNGGIDHLDAIDEQRGRADGVMIGRAAINDPAFVARAHAHVHGGAVVPLATIVTGLVEHARAEARRGTPLRAVARHALPLAHGMAGARRYRRELGEALADRSSDPDCLWRAAARVGIVE